MYDHFIRVDQLTVGHQQAFGSTASLETAYYRGTGKQLLLSEQQLMDCAWNSDDKHCGCPWLCSAASRISASLKRHQRVLIATALHIHPS